MAARHMIDTHLHVWWPSRLRYHWLSVDSHLYRDVTLDPLADVIMQVGITGGVLVEASNQPEEISMLLDYANEQTLPLVVVGSLDLESPEAADHIAYYACVPHFAGLRVNIFGGWQSSPQFHTSLVELEAHSLALDVLTEPKMLGVVAELARKHPFLPFVVNHMGGFDLHEIDPDEWKRAVAPLAETSNVFIKLSSLPHSAHEHTRALIRAAVSSFGPERLVVGSNYPLMEEDANYVDVYTTLSTLPGRTSQTARTIYWRQL